MSNSSKYTGEKGEQLACAYLQRQGYDILASNWRYGKAEVDIIARQHKVLVFVEVKTRSEGHWGQPEDWITPHKVKMLEQAAIGFLHETGHEWEFRFDVIAVVFRSHQAASLFHYPDAFFPEWNNYI